MQEKLVGVIGYRAAIAVSIETILFAVSLIIGLAFRSNVSAIASQIICIVLAVSVIIMTSAVYRRAPQGSRILGLLALTAAIVYAPFVMAVYFIQIAVVAPNPLGFPPEMLKALAFVSGSPMFALDMLGYFFYAFPRWPPHSPCRILGTNCCAFYVSCTELLHYQRLLRP